MMRPVIRILDVEEPQSEYPPDNPKAYNARRLFESPVVANNISSFHPDYFNITISYRSTATVYQPYNGAIKRDGTEKADEIWTVEQVKNAVEKKTKKVLAIITNCKVVQSARREYVEELSKHINVTKIGSCFGNRKSFEELKILLDEHHFVLAFENSICPEYTTEKYWRFNDLVVPVVMSRGVLNWDNVINGTFIVASDFKAPSALAEHLNSLINDKSKYMKYFEWTKTYRKNLLGTQWPAASRSNAGCQLCRIATLKPRLPPINMQEHWNVKECASDFGHYLINDTKTVKIMETQMAELVQRTAKKRSAYGKLDDL
ncbi:Glyco-tran-10-N domain-containing protein [Aphelenchoides besseyi]|nr:Glyco-tran-10-N domain-containing protein [Aphelenchoides besseyi]